MKKIFNKTDFHESFFTIAEVGQNHQGDIDTAINYVKKFSALGADAVKFQTRDNKYLFDKESYDKVYNSDNAFANTYGAHREFLELSKSDVRRLRNLCKEEDVLFMSTPFDEPSLDFLCEIDTDILKIASFDLGNLSFLKRMISKKKPLVLSCGGGQIAHIEGTIDYLSTNNADFCVLHCVSKYPCPAEELGLKQISKLIEKYPNVLIGLSDHFSGIVSGPLGYMKGARVFEKHVTFDRSLKGTDHSFALGPTGFEHFVRDIRYAKKMNTELNFKNAGEEPVFQKLGKSIAAYSDLREDTVLTLDHLRGKIFAEQGIPVRETNRLLGRKLNKAIKVGEKITWSDLVETK